MRSGSCLGKGQRGGKSFRDLSIAESQLLPAAAVVAATLAFLLHQRAELKKTMVSADEDWRTRMEGLVEGQGRALAQIHGKVDQLVDLLNALASNGPAQGKVSLSALT